ncbi:MAG TPA: hypothetical protein VLB12_15455 [Gemmatimonadales bacterium]|nr:hypothetical protein [Gemmatimonadales bacterium]HSE68385.1 hypothetical protein [Gemmatimonadales bacterium]
MSALGGVDRSEEELADVQDPHGLKLLADVETWIFDGNSYTSRPVLAWWTARSGFAPPSKLRRWKDYVTTLPRARALDDQVIYPHGLGDRRTDSDVGSDQVPAAVGRWRETGGDRLVQG